MKKLIFTLMMMAGLALVAGTAMGQNATTVTEGGTYNYELTNVFVNTPTGSSLTVAYNGTNATIGSIAHGGTSMSNGGAVPNTTSETLTFSITYSTGATDGNISVSVVDGGNGCSNSILLAITVQPAPTVDLTLADVADACQDTGAPGNNADAVSTSTGNTLGFATTIDMTNIPDNYTGTATLTLSGTGTTAALTDIAISGLASAVTGFSYTGTGLTGTLTWDQNAAFSSGSESLTLNVTFTTTEGLDDVDLTLTASAVSVTETGGGETYAEETGVGAGVNTQTTNVWAMPSIGGFN